MRRPSRLRFAQASRAYRPVAFSVPDFDALLSVRPGFPRQRRAVLAALGLDRAAHVSSRVDPSSAPAHALTPLGRTRRRGAGDPVEIVRSFGRGYVIPGLTLHVDGRARTGGLAVKGSGLEAWAAANRRWVERENVGRDLILGRVSRENAAGDLWGEFWARRAGVSCPITVYCARRGHVFQHARFWRCPYRVWELTSGPFRLGPGVTQAFVHLNWSLELAFALTYREPIRARARHCLESLSPKGYRVALGAMADTVLDNVVKLTAAGLQFSPYTLHLANIGYSGETTGFDRLKGPFAHPDAFRLGVLTTLVEVWAAVSWLGAAVDGGTPRFAPFFRRFQERLAASGAPRDIAHSFLQGGTVERVFARVDVGGLCIGHDAFLFARRQDGDIAAFLAACERFFAGLRMALEGGLRTVRDLDRWRDRAHFARAEETRVWQSKGGTLASGAFLRRVSDDRAVYDRYRRLLGTPEARHR